MTSYIRQQRPKSHIVVLGDQWTEKTAFPLLRTGVKGLLTYSDAKRQMHRALEAVAAGSYWVARTLLCRFLESIMSKPAVSVRRPRPTLIHDNVSRREQQILAAILENLSNKQIANQFNISERTVKFHVSNLLAKSGVQRRADLILRAFQRQNSAVPVIQ